MKESNSNWRLEKWKALTEVWNKEADRFWTRNHVFLIVNSALLMVLSGFTEEALMSLIFSSFGLIFSIFWYCVIVKGKYYMERWMPILQKLEKDDEIDVFGKELLESSAESKATKKYEPTSTYMKYVAISFALIWLTLIIYNLLKL